MKLILALILICCSNIVISKSIKEENAEMGGKLIAQKDFISAQKFFDKKEKDELLVAPKMIKSAYKYGLQLSKDRSEIIENINQFIRSFEPERLRAASYAALLDELERDNQMSNPIVIEIAFFMKREVERSKSENIGDRKYLTYDTDEVSYVDESVQALANQVQKKDYILTKKISSSWAGAFDAIVKKLVVKAYNGNSKNFDAVFGLKDGLYWLSHQDKVKETLHQEVMKNPNDQEVQLEKLKAVMPASRFNGMGFNSFNIG